MKALKLLPLFIPAFYSVYAMPVQIGPYTLYELDEHVYRIEDANDNNPAGIVWGEDGKPVNFNNCSDMYLIVGSNTAVLIDLSNEVKWDASAKESLRELVNEKVGRRDFAITFTHNHGDHLGMLSAFADDPNVEFWINEAEFPETDQFPLKQIKFIEGEGRLDLGGGMRIDYFEMPGHTPTLPFSSLRKRT